MNDAVKGPAGKAIRVGKAVVKVLLFVPIWAISFLFTVVLYPFRLVHKRLQPITRKMYGPVRRILTSPTSRRSIAVGLLAVLTIFWALSQYWSRLQVCTANLTVSGRDSVIRSCRGLGYSDIPAVVTLILVLLLLSPDFAALKFLGFEVKKEVAETREIADEVMRAMVASGLLNAKEQVEAKTDDFLGKPLNEMKGA